MFLKKKFENKNDTNFDTKKQKPPLFKVIIGMKSNLKD